MLGTLLALIYAHRQCQSVDREAVAQLDARLKEEGKKASETPLYYAGMFLSLTGKVDKAREYVDRLLKLSPEHEEGLVLKGWVELMAGKDTKARNIMQYFDTVLQRIPWHMDSLFGKAELYENRSSYKEAMDTLNILVMAYPGFTAPLLEKTKVNLSEQDWDQCLELANSTARNNGGGSCDQGQVDSLVTTISTEGRGRGGGQPLPSSSPSHYHNQQ